MESLKPDYRYWCLQVPRWELHEVCFLFLDVEPLPDSEVYESLISDRRNPIGRLYFALSNCLENQERTRGKATYIHKHTARHIREWVELAELHKFEIPADLFKAINAFVPPLSSPIAEKLAKTLGQSERESLVKLAYGMAKTKYDYDPNKVRSSAVPKIKDDLERCGITLDDETIRKYLREGAEYSNAYDDA